MLEQILREIKNYFIREVWSGNFSIESGALDVDFLLDGQYFKIQGSIFNDGVYQYPASDLKDEEFEGEIWALAVPPSVISLAEEVTDWNTANDAVIKSPYTSESFGGYSYSKASSSSRGNGESAGVTWKSVFADKLNEWRKIRYESAIRRYDYMRNSE